MSPSRTSQLGATTSPARGPCCRVGGVRGWNPRSYRPLKRVSWERPTLRARFVERPGHYCRTGGGREATPDTRNKRKSRPASATLRVSCRQVSPPVRASAVPGRSMYHPPPVDLLRRGSCRARSRPARHRLGRLRPEADGSLSRPVRPPAARGGQGETSETSETARGTYATDPHGCDPEEKRR